jgi:putative membrane protein
MKHPEKLLWNMFYFIVLLGVIKIIGNLIGIQFDEVSPIFNIIMLGAPIVLVLFHSSIILSPHRAIFFLLFAAVTGFTSEYLGLKYGQFFGTFYTYKPQLTFFTVPVQVLFYWAAFIYTGYSLTNSFLLWLKKKKPSNALKNWPLLLGTILLDGWFVLAIDLFMDPIEVKLGMWTWVNGGPYFGVPIGNFIGWFVVIVIASGVFRIYEYYFPGKEKKLPRSIFVIPPLCYGLVALTFIGMALQLHMYELGVIGSTLMLPVILYNLYLYFSTR